MVSFLNAPDDLASWDLVCRDFLAAGSEQWGFLAHRRFGVASSSGKSGWKLGVSFMRKPIMIEMHDQGDFGSGDDMSSATTIATNQWILATVSGPVTGVYQ